MDEKLQDQVLALCSGFPSTDVRVSHAFDLRRFARMTHYAWKHNIGFHPDMFKNALLASQKFQHLTEDELDAKSRNLCHQADLAVGLLHAAFDLENLTI